MQNSNSMRNKLLITLLAVALFVPTSCSDNYVDVDSFDENSENYFNSEQDYQDALIAAYDMLQSTYLNVLLGEIASDNTLAGGESATDVPGIQEIDDMRHTEVNQQLQDIWSWMYAGINRTDYILEFQDKTDFEGKDAVIGQTRFLRAYYYFELVKWFGPVPLSNDARLQFGAQDVIDRSSTEAVYQSIEEDLQEAISLLTNEDKGTGRATKAAAQALLGKVYLFQNKFSDAASVLGDVILSQEHDLMEDFSLIFENDYENNKESVFEIQYTDKEGAGFGCLQCSEGNVAVGFNGPRNYTGPAFESGFSFNVPVQSLYDLYEEGDVRRDIGILNIVSWADTTGATYAEGFEHTGFFNRKYIPRQGDLNTGDQNLTNPNNYRAIRYADVLLMAAEALNRGGIDDGQALIYLNRVRERAGLDPINLGGAQLTEAIWQERRLELSGEGHRFFDLVRTERAQDFIDGFEVGKHEIFPIPRIEIELAGNRWMQNPGY